MINAPESDPAGREIIALEAVSDWSLIFLPIKELPVVNRAVLFVANARNKFTELLKVKPSTLRHRMDKLGISYGWEKKKMS